MTQYLITALIDFFIAVLSFSKRGNKSAHALAAAAFCLGLWSVELFLLTVLSDLGSLTVWFHITRCGMFFIPCTLAFLAWRLTASSAKWFLYLVLVPGVAVSGVLSFLNLFIFPSELQQATGGYLPKADMIYYVFAVEFVYSLVMSLAVCILSYRSVTLRQKQRIKWLFITLLMTFLTGFLSIVLMPYAFYLSKFVGAAANITFVSLLFYSTIQYHLMDLRLALSEGLTRALLLSFFMMVYFSVKSAATDINGIVDGGVFTIVLILVMLEIYPRMLKWLLPNAKKLLSKDGYEYAAVVADSSKVLNDSVDFQGLVKVCDHLFFRIVRVRSYHLVFLGHENTYSGISSDDIARLSAYAVENDGFLLADETPPDIRNILNGKDASICAGLTHGGVLVGLLLIGPATSLSYYRYDDIRLFKWLQIELGQVLNRINQLDEMQDQLGQAKKTLSMLGVMNHYHHDIKAPLAIIDGVLSNDIYDKEKQKDIVLQQVERGSQLITTMASLLKGERKRKIQAISLKDVVRDSVFLFSQGIDEVNYLFGDAPEIQGDAEDLKILVINIVKNAIEARQDNQQLVVTISTWQTDSHVCLSFADTGVGMPEGRVDTLWEDATSSKSSGNGIGMQAIKRIADEHFAVIEVNSEVGRGSEFVFKFPNSVVVTEPNEQEGSREDIAESPFSNSTKAKKPLAG